MDLFLVFLIDFLHVLLVLELQMKPVKAICGQHRLWQISLSSKLSRNTSQLNNKTYSSQLSVVITANEQTILNALKPQDPRMRKLMIPLQPCTHAAECNAHE